MKTGNRQHVTNFFGNCAHVFRRTVSMRWLRWGPKRHHGTQLEVNQLSAGRGGGRGRQSFLAAEQGEEAGVTVTRLSLPPGTPSPADPVASGWAGQRPRPLWGQAWDKQPM